MKLRLLCVGRLSEPYLRDGCALFQERLRHYLPLAVEEIKEQKAGNRGDLLRAITAEGEQLLTRIPTGAFVVVLDERGRSLTSEELAGLLERHMVAGTGEWVMVIGGAHGLSDEVRRRADLLLSLSSMTLPHQVARLLLLEQLYRGCTIIRNEPYHHR
ncbi:MAG: 23S rRNA (pseudouridine(1915)-N(3))-methyltransferase RlmH [Desulfuromonadales bacterium]|nr:23S rRNA (pseudouridine(1915)-N(3))-methyltransferase RlmH [Desulfuromonadales bacterium]